VRKSVIAAAVAGALLAATPASAAPVVRQAAGPDAAAITGARDQFREDLGGGTTPGQNGSFGGLRREINWDGTPDNLSAPNELPANFFQARGAIFTGPGTGFMVSGDDNNPPDPDPDQLEFANFHFSYPFALGVFSAQKLFIPLGTTVYDVVFTVPGTDTPAWTKGFGAVFSDVDGPGSSIEYFDPSGKSLAKLEAPPAPGNEGLSFVGATFNAGERVARVRITNGTLAVDEQSFGAVNSPDVTQGGSGDLVALDDFLYGEPTALDTGADPAPALKLKGVKKKVSLADFAKGVRVTAQASEDVALDFQLRASSGSLGIKGGKNNVILAEKSLDFGSNGKAKLKPNAKLIRGLKKLKVQVRVVAIDRGGQRATAKKKIKVGG